MTLSRARGWNELGWLVAIAWMAVGGFAGCGGEGRAQRVVEPPGSSPEPPPSAGPDASVPDDVLDASTTAPPPDADDGFVKYWDGSTTPTADNVRGVDAGSNGDGRGSDDDAGPP